MQWSVESPVKLLLVSRSWPLTERSGVSLAAAAHAEMLVESGHSVAIVGAHPSVLHEGLGAARRYHVQASGSGALYSPGRVDRDALRAAIGEFNPQLVITEAWQTALTDAAIEIAHELRIPVLMVSHGVSLHPFTEQLRDRARALAWCFYRWYRLPRLVAKLSAVTTLSESARTQRFHDRDLARRLGKPVHKLGNFPVHWRAPVLARAQREAKIVVVGYFSAVKNQLSALEVLRLLPTALRLVFVGPRAGAYYDACANRAAAWGLLPRVSFLEDSECDLAEEIGSSLMLLSTSVTEALPICLLEGMASGTPVVATPVGAVPDLGAGLLSASPSGQANAAVALWQDAVLWEQESRKGLLAHEARFSRERVKQDLDAAVALTVGSTAPERLSN